MKRELDLDAVRGFMLVWMALTHLPTAITPWVNQPFGYFTSSEGFIFLSALFTGRIYYRLLTRGGVRKMSARLLVRTLRLYGYHVLLLAFAFIVAARYAIGAHSVGLYNLLDYYFAAGPSHAIVQSLLLIYRPPLLDIIPLYIIFLLMSPVVIVAATRIGWRLILGGSFVLWFLAQFGLREVSYAFLSHHAGLKIPLNEMGAFNLWGWQLVWIVGMWCGVRWARDDFPAEKWAKKLWVPSAVVAVAFCAVRYVQIFGLNLGQSSILFDKWHLGVVPVINSIAVALLLIRFRSFVKPLAIRPLVLMGQSSLQVFSAHFLFCFVGIGMMGAADRIYGGWKQVILVTCTFAALLLVAKVYARPELSSGTGGGREERAPARSIAPAEN